MARHVTLSALGPAALPVDLSLPDRQIVGLLRDHWRRHIERVLPDRPDLIVLHEACDRPAGWPMDRRQAYYDERGDALLEECARLAREGHVNIAYSAARHLPDGTWRNRTEILDREGVPAGHYDKNHLVPVEYEQAGILYGNAPALISLDFGTVAPAICFDLNYTELLSGVAALRPDVIAFSSMYHGGLMQAYWAYAARAHFIGAICGQPCAVISPVGKTLAESTNYFPRVTARVNLDCAVVHLDENWKRIEAARDRYGEGLVMDDPGYLGSVLLRCETPDASIGDILREFEIAPLDDYFDRCRAHRRLPGRLAPPE